MTYNAFGGTLNLTLSIYFSDATVWHGYADEHTPDNNTA